MNKKVKNIVLTLCFFITAIFCVNVSANAESYKAYTISSQNTRVYSNTALTSPKGWIYGSDEVTVLDIGNTYCYVRYPISGGKTKEGYISFSSLFTASRGSLYTSRAMITTYRRPGGSSYGSVYKNDSVLVMGTSGSYTQIRYPVSGGYKFAFIRTSDCNSYIKPAASQNRSVYNDVFASTKGKGYNLSQARSSSSTSFTKGQFIYIWGYLHDANDNLYKSFGSGTCNMTLSIYKPDGSCAFSYEYKNSDNNWIGHQLDVAGTWKIQSRITGSLSGTNTQTITVRDTQSPTSYSTTYYVTTTAGLILRKGPGTGYDKILTMPYASSLMVASVSGGWAKAKYNGYEGYCSSSYISKTKPAPQTPKPAGSGWQMPMTNAYVCGNNWLTYYRNRPSRPYHLGLDLASRNRDANVYAASTGTVAATGYNSANGYYVIIRHSLSGKTVYSFYCHLKSYCVSRNTSVSKGTKIGIYGNTGSSSAGSHLHFAIIDSLSSSGGYYGYGSISSGNKVYYAGMTYSNPTYIINNGRLP